MCDVRSRTDLGIGARVRRNEDARFLSGRGQFLADITLPGVQEIAFLRSPFAHGFITQLDAPASSEDRVVTARDLDWVKPITAIADIPGFKTSEQPILATEKVRFVGEAIAMCIGPSRSEAEDVAAEVSLEIDELPAVVDVEAAMSSSESLVHEHWGDNLFLTHSIEAGAIDEIAESASVVIRRRYRMNRQAGVPLECRGVAAYRDPRLDELVVYSSTQFPHVIRTILAELLDLPEHRLRVVAPDVGGGFGIKNILQPEEVAIAALAMTVNHPVRWIEDRREHLVASTHARDHLYEITAYADDEGRVLGIDADITVDSGAYSVWPWTAAMEAGMAAGILPGPYDLRHYRARMHTVATNKSPMGPYRGVARPGACFAIERTIDEVARAVGIEPHEARMKNMIPPDAMPYVSVTGKHYDSGDYSQGVRRAADLINIAQIRDRQQHKLGDGRLIGLGFASYTEQTAHGTDEWVARGLPVIFGYESARARMMPDGELVLEVGIQSHGQGLETTLAQIAHEVLGVDPARVAVRHGDSSLSPYGMGTFASRSMVMAGGAVARACVLLSEKISLIGARLLDCAAEAVTVESGQVLGPDGAGVSFAEVGNAAYLHPEKLEGELEPGLEVTAVYEPAVGTGAYAYSTHAAVVAVDPDIGHVEIVDYVVVEDCGTLVNPMVVEGQILGGVAQGIGTALYEEIPYDERGQPLASTFMDYLLPGASEVPLVRIEHLNTPSPHTAFGIKGMGEGPTIAVAPAVVNAINDALRSGLGFGEVNETPVTPKRLLEAIDKGELESVGAPGAVKVSPGQPNPADAVR